MPSTRISRCLDVAAATIGLALASPVLVIAAVAIKVADPGTVLYRQPRTGINGRPFAILKLRTMTSDAEHQGLGLLVAQNDPRITRPGKWLRASSIDELPQLWNVLRGDMALVGPRPTVKSQTDQYTPQQRRRLEVKPGLTGWAQINGRNSLSWPERIELDVWYVEHKSLALDFAIILKTPLALLKPAALYGPAGATRDLNG